MTEQSEHEASLNRLLKAWIIGLLSCGALAIAVFSILKVFEPIQLSPVGRTMGDIGAFNPAMALYRIDVQSGHFPATTLMQLVSDNAAGWAGPYMATIRKDPWNNCYTYTGNGTTYTIQSVHTASPHKSETIRYIFTGSDTASVMEQIP